MNTGTAIAKQERTFTAREAVTAIKQCGDHCAAALTLEAIEQFGIGLTEPRVGGGRWIAGCVVEGRRVLEFGDSVIEAVGEVLRKMGGEK